MSLDKNNFISWEKAKNELCKNNKEIYEYLHLIDYLHRNINDSKDALEMILKIVWILIIYPSGIFAYRRYFND